MITTMRGLTIGKLAEETGVHLETIRYYERIGLLPTPGRTEGGHRSYDRALVRRLVFIRRGRDLGFKLEEIRALLALAEPGKTSCAAVREIAGPHLRNVREKIVRLQRLEGILADAVTRCASAASADLSTAEQFQATGAE